MARRTQRRPGDGSIFYDKKRRRWVAMLSQPTAEEGKRRRLRRTFPTRDDAKAFLDKQTTPALNVSADVTVSDLLDGWQEWLHRRGETGLLAPNTVTGYGHATTHVRAAFGRCQAIEVGVDDVERFLATQSRKHSGRYVVLQRNVLDQAYRWGQRNRLLTWNPAQLSTCPTQLLHKPGLALTAEQTQRLLETSRGDRFHALWAVMVGAGLRPGEAMGLTWSCIQLDVEPAVIHIRAYLRKGPNGMFLGAPKTTRSARSLDIPAFVTKALEAHRTGYQSPTEGPWQGLVFATGKTAPRMGTGTSDGP